MRGDIERAATRRFNAITPLQTGLAIAAGSALVVGIVALYRTRKKVLPLELIPYGHVPSGASPKPRNYSEVPPVRAPETQVGVSDGVFTPGQDHAQWRVGSPATVVLPPKQGAQVVQTDVAVERMEGEAYSPAPLEDFDVEVRPPDAGSQTSGALEITFFRTGTHRVTAVSMNADGSTTRYVLELDVLPASAAPLESVEHPANLIVINDFDTLMRYQESQLGVLGDGPVARPAVVVYSSRRSGTTYRSIIEPLLASARQNPDIWHVLVNYDQVGYSIGGDTPGSDAATIIGGTPLNYTMIHAAPFGLGTVQLDRYGENVEVCYVDPVEQFELCSSEATDIDSNDPVAVQVAFQSAAQKARSLSMSQTSENT